MSPDFRSEDADDRLWDCVSRLSRLIVAGRKKEMAQQAGTVRACVRGARGGDAGRKERGRNWLCFWASPSVSWMMDVKMDCSFIILIGWIICAPHNCLLFIAETLLAPFKLHYLVWFLLQHLHHGLAISPTKIKVAQEFPRLTLICGIVPHCYCIWAFKN